MSYNRLQKLWSSWTNSSAATFFRKF